MIALKEPNAIGVYDNLDTAERTIDELRRAGFPSDEIGIIGHVGVEDAVPTPLQMHRPEDNAIAGLVRGGLVGAAVGALVILVIPGLGAVTGLGQWFEVLGGAALGAVVCGVMIAFSSFIFARPSTRLLAAELEKGHFIVTIKNSSRQEEAVDVLRRKGLLSMKQND